MHSHYPLVASAAASISVGEDVQHYFKETQKEMLQMFEDCALVINDVQAALTTLYGEPTLCHQLMFGAVWHGGNAVRATDPAT